MQTIGVSVCVFTYNYENYLALALESILKQKCNFPIEIVIGDDLSTDNTRKISEQYFSRYPDIIRLSFNETNIGGTHNWVKTISICKGKYIALLDGDDYFTDVNKLQNQFDCLENNDDAVLCFHAVEEIYEGEENRNTIVRFDKERYGVEDFLSRGWFIRTGSTFFKNGILPKNPPPWVYDFPYRYDTIMHVLLGLKGITIYIDEPMSVWLKHSKGMSGELLKDKVKNFYSEINMACKLNEHTGYKYDKIVKKYVSILYAGIFLHLLRDKLWVSNFKVLPKLFIQANWNTIGKRIINRLSK